MANNRITRDLDERLQGRVEEIKARNEMSSPDEAVKRERLEAFRDKWSNNALPDVPGGLLPGMHLCRLSTTNRQDVPRIDFRNADGTLSSCGRLLLEPQRTNSIRNSSMVGAVAGSPGTLPTNWTRQNSSGLTQGVSLTHYLRLQSLRYAR